jgi:predicted NAD/FAD-dependent oxidoreductase
MKTNDNLSKLYVGLPKSSIITKYLSLGLDIKLQFKVANIIKINSGWKLFSDDKKMPIHMTMFSHLYPYLNY